MPIPAMVMVELDAILSQFRWGIVPLGDERFAGIGNEVAGDGRAGGMLSYPGVAEVAVAVIV